MSSHWDGHFGERFCAECIPISDLRKIIVEFARPFSGVVESIRVASNSALEIRVEMDQVKEIHFRGLRWQQQLQYLNFVTVRCLSEFVCSPHSNATEFDFWFSQIPYHFSWHYCLPRECTYSRMHTVKTIDELLEQLFYVQINKTDTMKPRYSYLAGVKRHDFCSCAGAAAATKGQCVWYI